MADTESGGKLSVLDLNSATIEQLETLPGVGPVMAQRIVDFRTKYGFFRRPEYLLMVRGMSDRHYRKIAPFLYLQ